MAQQSPWMPLFADALSGAGRGLLQASAGGVPYGQQAPSYLGAMGLGMDQALQTGIAKRKQEAAAQAEIERQMAIEKQKQQNWLAKFGLDKEKFAGMQEWRQTQDENEDNRLAAQKAYQAEQIDLQRGGLNLRRAKFGATQAQRAAEAQREADERAASERQNALAKTYVEEKAQQNPMFAPLANQGRLTGNWVDVATKINGQEFSSLNAAAEQRREQEREASERQAEAARAAEDAAGMASFLQGRVADGDEDAKAAVAKARTPKEQYDLYQTLLKEKRAAQRKLQERAADAEQKRKDQGLQLAAVETQAANINDLAERGDPLGVRLRQEIKMLGGTPEAVKEATKTYIKADRERKQALKNGREGYLEMKRKMEDSRRKLEAIRKLNSRSTSGLIQWAFRGIPQTQQKAKEELVKSLKSELGFEKLMEMKTDSRNKTGGALGQVTEKELEFLQSAIRSLDTANNLEQFTAALDEIELRMRNTEGYYLQDWNTAIQGNHFGIGAELIGGGAAFSPQGGAGLSGTPRRRPD